MYDMGWCCTCFSKRHIDNKVGCLDTVNDGNEGTLVLNTALAAAAIEKFQSPSSILDESSQLIKHSTADTHNIQMPEPAIDTTTRICIRNEDKNDVEFFQDCKKRLRMCCSVSDIAHVHALHLNVSRKDDLIHNSIPISRINRVSTSMPSILVKNAELGTLVEGDERRRRSSVNTTASDLSKSNKNTEMRGNTYPSTQLNNGNDENEASLRIQEKCFDPMCRSFLSIENFEEQTGTFESSILVDGNLRCHEIVNEDDWVTVSDDETIDSSLIATPRHMVFPGLNMPSITIPVLSSGLSRNGSYIFSKSGSLQLDGLSGIEITNTGITKSNELSSFDIPFKNRFIFMNKLGQGFSATVFKAFDICTKQIVALKVVSITDRSKRHMIARELTSLNRLLGKYCDEINKNGANNIVQFIDAFSMPNDENVVICLEYMDGGSLQDVIDKGGCPNEAVLANICYQSLRGLEFLHNNGQIHRDIKPANILISTNGKVKISDLGISRYLGVSDKEIQQRCSLLSSSGSSGDITNITCSANAAQTFVGTLTYLSPERINGESYGFSADIWGLALSILATALGVTLFNSNEFWSIMDCLNNAAPPGLPDDDTRFTSDFRRFLEICLQKNPNDRPCCVDLQQHPFIGLRTITSIPSTIANEGSIDEVRALFDSLKSHYLKIGRSDSTQTSLEFVKVKIKQLLLSSFEDVTCLAKQLHLTTECVRDMALKFTNCVS